MKKSKSEAWYAAMHARKGKGTNHYTKAKELGLPKPSISKESHLKRSKANSKPHTEETKIKISQARIKYFAENPDKKPGGYKKGSGGGKKGWYKGFFCDSSWELAYVIYCLDHNIKIERNTQKYQYYWNGMYRNYIPDFIVEGIITEIKGYKTKQWMAKLEANPNIKVLYEEEMLPILNYVKSKYGLNFINLYNH